MEINCFLLEEERRHCDSAVPIENLVDVREGFSSLVEAIIKTDRNYIV